MPPTSGMFLLNSDNSLGQIAVFAGGFYILILIAYIMTAIINSIQEGEGIIRSSQLTTLLYISAIGTIVVSGWLGYSKSGLLVAGTIGAVPAIAFTTFAFTLSIFDLNDPDTYIWVFALPMLVAGLLLAALGFLAGKGIHFATT